MQLKLDRVSRKYPSGFALQDVSLNFSPGTITAILGANGAGKSTLLKLIAGSIAATSGRITWGERLVKPSRAEVRREMHLIDTPRANDGRCSKRITEMISHYGTRRESLGDEAVEWMRQLNLLGVYDKRAREISKGQRYKIAMIALFLTRPKIWLFDEPFSSGLDANGLNILQQEMKGHAASGGLVLFSTQWPQQAKELADRLIVIDRANLVWDNEACVVPDQDMMLSSDVSLKSVLQGIGQ